MCVCVYIRVRKMLRCASIRAEAFSLLIRVETFKILKKAIPNCIDALPRANPNY